MSVDLDITPGKWVQLNVPDGALRIRKTPVPGYKQQEPLRPYAKQEPWPGHCSGDETWVAADSIDDQIATLCVPQFKAVADAGDGYHDKTSLLNLVKLGKSIKSLKARIKELKGETN